MAKNYRVTNGSSFDKSWMPPPTNPYLLNFIAYRVLFVCAKNGSWDIILWIVV